VTTVAILKGSVMVTSSSDSSHAAFLMPLGEPDGGFLATVVSLRPAAGWSVPCGSKRPHVRDDSPQIVLTQDSAVGRHRRSAFRDAFVEIVDRKVATA
jgi:hypothetical protein